MNLCAKVEEPRTKQKTRTLPRQRKTIYCSADHFAMFMGFVITSVCTRLSRIKKIAEGHKISAKSFNRSKILKTWWAPLLESDNLRFSNPKVDTQITTYIPSIPNKCIHSSRDYKHSKHLDGLQIDSTN